MKWGTLAIALQIPFNPPDEALPEVLEHLQRPDFTLEVCAEWLRTDLQSLCAFLTSDRGLALLAHTELAQAIHIRAIAIAQLPRVIDAMRFALEDFADTCRNVPLNPNSMQACEFVERAKETARKNGQLLLRLAHFSPRPLRSYAPPPHSPSQREGAGGWVSSPSNSATAIPAPPSASSPRAREVGGENRFAATLNQDQTGEANPAHLNAHAVQSIPAAEPLAASKTNPTRERVVTHAPTAQPTHRNHSLPSPSPASTNPEREQAGCLLTSDIPHPKSDIPCRAPPQLQPIA